MIVFDLKCDSGHVFEAWFGSSDDYEGQKARGLVTCPMCGDSGITKAVMAPAVAAKGNQRPTPPMPHNVIQSEPHAVASMPPEAVAKMQEVIEQLARVQAKILEDSVWVGSDFADKARAMHYGEQPASLIHGTTDRDEARALIEEGIAVAPLPLPVVPPGKRN